MSGVASVTLAAALAILSVQPSMFLHPLGWPLLLVLAALLFLAALLTLPLRLAQHWDRADDPT